MADGGACSSDPFRLPDDEEELSCPFGNGLVVRYGYSTRLVANTVAIAGVTAELPPSTQEPYRLLYFVVMDHVGTTLAILRVVLKEGVNAADKTTKALIIDNLCTLDLYRKQGLATSLINFVKGIARAHSIVLYSRCSEYLRKFWELRGFYEEMLSDVVNLYYPIDEFSVSTLLLRAGRGYTEYQPATAERLSNIRAFNHGLSSDDAVADLPLERANSFISAWGSVGGGVDDAAAATRYFGEAPTFEGMTLPHLDTSFVAPSPPLTDARLARHDQEEAKRLSSSSPTGEMPPPADAVGTETAAAAAAAAAADQNRSALAQRTATGGWPGIPIPFGAGGAGNNGVAGRMEWPPLQRYLPGVVDAMAGGEPSPEEIAVRALAALPGAGAASTFVDLTDAQDRGGRSLADQEAEQMQLAIAMSLLTEDDNAGGGRGGRGEGGAGADVVPQDGGGEAGCQAAGQRAPGGSTQSPPTTAGSSRLGDDTETDEDPAYGAQPSARDGASNGTAPSETNVSPAMMSQADGSLASSGDSSGTEGLLTAPVFPALTGPASVVGVGAVVDEVVRGSLVTGAGSGGFGRGGRKTSRGRGRGGQDNNDLRRLRRRRDEGGASTPGEESPDGANAENEPVDGKVLGRAGGHGGQGSGRPRQGDAARAADSSPGVVPAVLARALSPCASINARMVLPETSAPGGGGGGCGPLANVASLGGDRSQLTIGMGAIASVTSAPSVARGGGGGIDGGITLTNGASWGGVVSSQPPATDRVYFPSPVNGGETATVNSTTMRSAVAAASSAPRDGVAAGTAALMSSFVSPLSEAAAPSGGQLGRMATGQQQQQLDLQRPMAIGQQQQLQLQRPIVTNQLQQLQQLPLEHPMVSDQQHHQQGWGGYARLPCRDPLQPQQALSGSVAGGGGGGDFDAEGLDPDALLRSLDVGTGVGNGSVGGGGGLDGLLAAAAWEQDDAEDELRRAVEASRQSLEDEMMLKATQESREAAMAAATADAVAEARSPCLPPPPSHSPADGAGTLAARPAAVTVGNSNGNALPVAPAAGSRLEVTGGQNVATFPGGNVGSARQVGEGQVVGGVAGAGAGVNAAWLNAWDDAGEVIAFIGKGKGRCSDR